MCNRMTKGNERERERERERGRESAAWDCTQHNTTQHNVQTAECNSTNLLTFHVEQSETRDDNDNDNAISTTKSEQTTNKGGTNGESPSVTLKSILVCNLVANRAYCVERGWGMVR
jgi:hypothetical protein